MKKERNNRTAASHILITKHLAENAALKEQVAQLEAKNAMQHIVLEDYGVTHDQQQETIAQQAEQHAFAL